jgi:DNA-binding transcriptional MerR regulator
MTTLYRTKAFATLTGVTVKALHHYDRLGLLKPRRTQAGYRLYTDADRERLEHIAALKFIGLPLKQIKAMLDTRSSRAGDALLRQRRLLEEQRQRLDRALKAIDWELYEEERARRSAGITRPPDRFDEARVSLYQDIAAAIREGVDVGGERARSLIARWRALVDDELQDVDDAARTKMKDMWAGRKTWPPSLKRYVATLYRLEPAAWERVADFLDQGLEALEAGGWRLGAGG